MKSQSWKRIALLATIAVACTLPLVGASDSHAVAAKPDDVKGMAVAYPWTLVKGKDTPRRTAYATVDEITRKAGYATVPHDLAVKTWNSMGASSRRPTNAALSKFGKKLKASVVVHGSIAWHTRSIWVGSGPKTISTATVSAYVFDVRAGKVIYKKTGVTGRSDEKENTLKIVADVLVTPLVSVVSGGPATPHEQRAAQIALSRALHEWVVKSK
jgi:hypothetical protein